jgi:predicted Rossmann-fold nucleotide-binding protein
MDSCIPKEEEEEEAYTKSTLKYLNIDNMEIRKAHMVWEAAGYETVSIKSHD